MNSNQSSNIAAVLSNTTNQNNISNGLSVTSNNSGNSTNSNYSASKLSGKAREAAEKLTQERKKATLVVVHQFLSENGFLSAARELANNIGFNLSSVSCADNVDLDSIFIEYEEYYTMKFGKKPKFFRKNDGSAQPYNYTRTGGEMEKEHKTSKPYSSSNPLLNKMRQRVAQQGTLPVTSGVSSTNSNTKQSSRSNSATQKLSSTSSTNDRKKVLVKSSSTSKNATVPQDAIDVSGKKLSTDDPPLGEDESSLQQQSDSDDDYFEERILRPLPEEFYFGEMRELAEVIRRDILVSNPEVHWDDIAGLADAKQLIKEAVVIPLKYPELFNTIPVLSPWNGVLLFGPPGTGKTMLAKAVATECRTTFFNISASSIVSKWRGDSEKLVRILFELAEHYSPSTIFLDELDSIMSQRQSGSSGSEHEGSRRMKTELLIQMDGLSKRKGQVFVLAASNLPWDLDQAMLRRLEKRILVGLPDETSRKHIMEKLLAHDDYSSLSAADYEVLAKETTNYSGADLSLVCKESAMKKLRQVMFHIAQMERDNTTPTNLNPTLMLQKNKITLQDVQNALFSTKPSGGAYKAMYEEWQHKYGSNGAV